MPVDFLSIGVNEFEDYPLSVSVYLHRPETIIVSELALLVDLDRGINLVASQPIYKIGNSLVL